MRYKQLSWHSTVQIWQGHAFVYITLVKYQQLIHLVFLQILSAGNTLLRLTVPIWVKLTLTVQQQSERGA